MYNSPIYANVLLCLLYAYKFCTKIVSSEDLLIQKYLMFTLEHFAYASEQFVGVRPTYHIDYS